MARAGSFILDSGDKFPAFTLQTVNHGEVRLPDVFEQWGVFLIYRGHW